MWKLIHCFKHCNKLQTLNFAANIATCGLETVLKHCDMVSLRTLSLSTYGGCHGDDPGGEWPFGSQSNLESSLKRLSSLFTDHCGRGLMTTLRLSHPAVDASITKSVVQWPARLVRFDLTMVKYTEYAHQYTAFAVQKMLDHHKESLECVRLGILSQDQGSTYFIPDLSQFLRLRTLQLSSYNLLQENPLVAAEKLGGNACMLKYLDVSFSMEIPDPDTFYDFQLDDVQWFRDFVTRMKSQDVTPNRSPSQRLDSIHINCNPVQHLPTFEICIPALKDRIRVHPWPWEHVDQAAKAVGKLGIKMTYTATFTKREWVRGVRRAWRKERCCYAIGRATIAPQWGPVFGTVPDPQPRGIERYFKPAANGKAS